MASNSFTFTGKVTHIPLSGGFWGIETPEGKQFRPVNELPALFAREGCEVRVKASASNSMSIFMWGQGIHIHHIEAV